MNREKTSTVPVLLSSLLVYVLYVAVGYLYVSHGDITRLLLLFVATVPLIVPIVPASMFIKREDTRPFLAITGYLIMLAVMYWATHSLLAGIALLAGFGLYGLYSIFILWRER